MLPVAAFAMLALVPVRLTGLAADWGAAYPRLAESARPPAEAGQTLVALSDGVVARQLVSATLAGGPRAAPVGEDHPADGRLLAEVARRQAELDKRQHELDTKSAQVEAAEVLAKGQIAELSRLRGEIEGLMVHETGAATADIDILVGLYQNMKPPQAAAVLGKMEPQRAGMILQHLGDRNGGPILAAMDPAAALAISEDIAQRRSAFRP